MITTNAQCTGPGVVRPATVSSPLAFVRPAGHSRCDGAPSRRSAGPPCRPDRAQSSAPEKSLPPDRRANRAARDVIARTSRPSILTLPSICVRRGGSRRIRARKVTLLPEPDSPRMHSTSPGCTLKLTPLTACTVASRVTNRTLSSSTSANAILRCPISAVAREGIAHVARRYMRARAFQGTEGRIHRLANLLGKGTTGVEAAA